MDYVDLVDRESGEHRLVPITGLSDPRSAYHPHLLMVDDDERKALRAITHGWDLRQSTGASMTRWSRWLVGVWAVLASAAVVGSFVLQIVK